jgi:hypothetical protein
LGYLDIIEPINLSTFSEDPDISKQGTAGKSSSGSQREVMVLYNTGLSTTCDIKKWKGQLRSITAHVKV